MAEEKLYGTVLLRAKDILDALLDTDGGLTLKELAEKVEESKSTTLKVLTTLEHIHMVRRDSKDKRFFIGAKMISYGEKAKEDFDILDAASPYLIELNKQTNETINLGVEVNDQMVYIEKLDSTLPVKLDSKMGGTIEMYCSAMGKAVLATESDEEVADYLEQVKLVPFTKNTITDPEVLKAQLPEIRKNGYAIDDGENQPGVICVGATIQKGGHIYGAFSVSTPEYRLDETKLNDIKSLILSTKAQIEKKL